MALPGDYSLYSACLSECHRTANDYYENLGVGRSDHDSDRDDVYLRLVVQPNSKRFPANRIPCPGQLVQLFDQIQPKGRD